MRYALAGAGIVSVNAMIVAVLVLIGAVRSGNFTAGAQMIFILLLLWVAGAVGGMTYGALANWGDAGAIKYYLRWIIAAEAALIAFLAEV